MALEARGHKVGKGLNDIKIDSPFDFSLLIERILRESKSVPNQKAQTALENFAMECFNAGFKAGKLPINNHRFGDATK